MPVNIIPMPASTVISARQMLWHTLQELPMAARNAEKPLNELRSFALSERIRPAGLPAIMFCDSDSAPCKKLTITKTSKLYKICKALLFKPIFKKGIKAQHHGSETEAVLF